MAGITTLTAALALVGSGCGGSSGATALKVAFGPDDGSRGLVVFHVRCDPPGGSIPAPAAACARITSRPRLVTPPPSNSTCSPGIGQWAVSITGSYRGQAVRQHFGACDNQVFAWMRLARYRPCPDNFMDFANPCDHGPYAFGKAHMRGVFPNVPRVVGMTAAAARRVLRRQGLEARFIPAFTARRRVIRQSPRPRTSARVYALVTLRIAGS
ncbi:MAG TPA: PASTA domain-containing protein [Gaiellales bacterium]|jgi:hypothetical protein|nr:PASTA domain-containing protein [Gaiellales bacterium]